MANKMTPFINDQNVQNVRVQIDKKKGCDPYLATVNQAGQVLTDYDTFPYPRWFRGIPRSSDPVVAEREAGWRTINDSCYRVLEPNVDNGWGYPNHCFEAACSTVFPCYPSYMQNISDRGALNLILNKACITQYR